jgi:uroporphyrinogen-III synthase
MNLKSIANQKVYISRNPDEAELFTKMVSAAGFQVEAVNPVRYQTVEIPVIPYADWFFFTSIRTVDHYFDQDLQLPANIRVAAMGSGTAQALKRHGIQPDFTGADGNTRDTAQAFSELAKGTEVLFPIAAESLRSIQNQISTQAIVKEVVVYESQPADFPHQISADIYVFTSPSCVNSFIQAQGKPTGKVIAIGRTTAEALQNQGIAQVILPPFTTEESLADTVCGL